MSARFFLDTNILVYAHDASEPLKQAKSRELVCEAVRSGDGVISPQVLSEFFVTVTRKIEVPVAEDKARREIVLLGSLCTVDLDATLVIRALDLRSRWNVNYWDAMILAAAERAVCPTLYSEDLSDGQSYGDVRVVNPFTK
jgi:predicted nucleic acid-binding protein